MHATNQFPLMGQKGILLAPNLLHHVAIEHGHFLRKEYPYVVSESKGTLCLALLC